MGDETILDGIDETVYEGNDEDSKDRPASFDEVEGELREICQNLVRASTTRFCTF